MAFIFGFLLITSALASPSTIDLEVAIGRSAFCCTNDGVWWQSQFGFNGQLRVLTYEVGARWRVANWGVALRYADLGKASGMNLASVRDDEFGKYDTSKPCNTNTQSNCLAIFAVDQNVRAVMLGASYRVSIQGAQVEPEIGQVFYQSSLKVSIYCPNCGIGSKYAFGEGGTFVSTSEIRRSPYVALRLTYKRVTLTYRYILNIDGNGARTEGIEAQFASGLTHGPLNQIMLGVSL